VPIEKRRSRILLRGDGHSATDGVVEEESEDP